MKAWRIRLFLFAPSSPALPCDFSEGQSNLSPNIPLNQEFRDRTVEETCSMHLCKFFIKRHVPTLGSYLPFIWILNERSGYAISWCYNGYESRALQAGPHCKLTHYCNILVFHKIICLPNSNLYCSNHVFCFYVCDKQVE